MKDVVNFHPSLLPYYGGPVPSYWCIKNGELFTGFTLHRVTEKIDNGELLYQSVLQIQPEDNEIILDKKISMEASKFLHKYLDYVMGKELIIKKIVNADEVYKYHIKYLSFPKR